MNGEARTGWRSTDLMIVLAGLATSMAVLAGVFFLARADPDFSIMAWYALFIVPAGAVIVGIAAGSGYGLASWLAGRKVSGTLLGLILALLLGAWGGAQWLQFRSLHLVRLDSGIPVGFFEYFDFTTRSMALTFGHGKTSSGELGLLGYLFRLLEAAGFVGGGLVIPLVLRAKPYCDRCQSYMRQRASWWFAAAVAPRKIARKDAAGRDAYAVEMKAALESGLAVAQRLVEAVAARDSSAFQSALTPAIPAKSVLKLERRIEARLVACPHCGDGQLIVNLHSGHGDKSRTEQIARPDLDGGFTRSLALPGRGKE
jgi:hypothetical protein